jgi:opacity protein-like surface antigen
MLGRAQMSLQKIGFWLTAATLGTLLPARALLAADMPVKARPPAPAYYDWSGVYVGVHAGYGGGMTDWNDQGFDFAARGFLGGGQVGINKQIASLVFGLELDGSWANFNGSQTFSFGGPIIGFQSVGSATSKIDGFVTLAGRAGLAADRWFVYAKGGMAFAHEKHSFSVVATQFPGGVDSFAVSGSEDRWGPMVGFGTEYALGSNWSVKAEYNYMNFAARTPRLTGTLTTAGVTTPFSVDTEIEQAAIHVVKAGVNYRFGGIQVDPTFAPVPAAPGYNWSGAYIGAQGGYGFGHKEWPDFFGITPTSGKFDANGWLAGGTVGVNAQAGAFVFGVEGEWMWTGIKGSQTFTTDLGGGGFRTDSLESKINWLAIASARAGFVVGDRLLVYAKGGVALADEKHSHNLAQSVVGFGTVTASLSGRAVHTGIVVGAGAEYALGGNWSAKLEYDYIRMLAQNVIVTGTEAANIPILAVGTIDFAEQFTGIRQDLHVIKLGVNYHFNPVPVVVSAHY